MINTSDDRRHRHQQIPKPALQPKDHFVLAEFDFHSNERRNRPCIRNVSVHDCAEIHCMRMHPQLLRLAEDLVNLSFIDDSTTFRAPGLGPELSTQVVNIDFAISELLH